MGATAVLAVARSIGVTDVGMEVCVAAGTESELCRGPEDQPPDDGPNGEMEGAAGSEEAGVGRVGGVEAAREVAIDDAGAEAGREGTADADGRELDEDETPLRSSSRGMRRWA